MKIVRSILGVMVGWIVSSAVVAAVEAIGHAMYPEYVVKDMEKAAEIVATMPAAPMAMVLIAWLTGAFVGGAVAALIAGHARLVHAALASLLVWFGVIFMVLMIPTQPLWMKIAGLALPIPLALAAGKIVAILLPPSPPPRPESFS